MALLLSLYAETLKRTPVHLLAGIALFVGSQLCLLAALLLPWKLLVVLSTGAPFPGLPAPFAATDGRAQALALALAIPAALLLHLLAELGLAWICRDGAACILRRHAKTGLFQDYRAHARRIYADLLRALAAIAFCTLVALWLIPNYPLLLAPLLSYVGGWWLLRALRGGGAPPGPAAAALRQAWWHLGFVYALCWVIWDYWRGGSPPLLTVFVAMVLVRQALLFAALAARQLGAVKAERSRAPALFLHDAQWRPPVPEAGPAFAALLQPQARRRWIARLLEAQGLAGTPRDILLRPAEAGQVAYLAVHLQDGGEAASSVLVKLFAPGREAAGEHEAELLRAAQPHWPAPALLADTRVEDCVCLVLRWERGLAWLDAAERLRRLAWLRTRLLGCELPGPLVRRYERARPALAERLQAVSWPRLQALAGSAAATDACARLEQAWPAMTATLAALPRQLVLPRLERRVMAGSPGREAPLHLCNWSRWRWEPVGAGWPVDARAGQALHRALQQAARDRPALAAVDPALAARAAQLHEFERRHAAGDCAGALDLAVALAASVPGAPRGPGSSA